MHATGTHAFVVQLGGSVHPAGVSVESGVARVSLVHYNTMAEIHRFGNVLSELRAGLHKGG